MDQIFAVLGRRNSKTPPDLSAPWPCWGQSPQTPVIGWRSALATRPPLLNCWIHPCLRCSAVRENLRAASLLLSRYCAFLSPTVDLPVTLQPTTVFTPWLSRISLQKNQSFLYRPQPFKQSSNVPLIPPSSLHINSFLLIYTVSQKKLHFCFYHNFVKFPRILIIFGK